MYNLFISVAAGVLVTVLIRALGFGVIAGVVPGTIAFFATFVLLARRVANRVQALVSLAQKELSVQPANPRERQQRVEKAIGILDQGLAYDRWQFLVGSEIHAQIGMIRYMTKDLDAALPHLLKASDRNYMAKSLLGALYFQRKDYSKVDSAFEAAVRSGKKEAVVWAAYAWCKIQLKEKEKALQIMARAVDANPSDEKLKSGLTALQNDKKMKMKPYEPLWWQFGLEQPPLQMQGGGGRRVQFERR